MRTPLTALPLVIALEAFQEAATAVLDYGPTPSRARDLQDALKALQAVYEYAVKTGLPGVVEPPGALELVSVLLE